MKTNLSLKLLLFGLALVACTETFGESPWVELKNVENVVVLAQEDVCVGKNVIFLRMINNNERNVKVEFTSFNGDKKRSIILSPGKNVNGSCSSISPSQLVVPVSEGKSLTDLNLSITVTKN